MRPLPESAARPLLALLFACTLLPLAACNRAPGAPVVPPVLIFWNTGDRADVAEAQTGVDDEDSSFGEVTGLAGADARARVACGPAEAGPHPPYAVRFSAATADAEPYELTLILDHFEAGHDGPYEAAAHLARLGADGAYEETTGTATVEMKAPGHLAGNFIASGSFEATLGGRTVTGSFDECYYFA